MLCRNSSIYEWGVIHWCGHVNITLKVPEGSIAAYQQAEGWKDFANITDLATGIASIQQKNGKDASVYNLNGTRVKDSKKLSKGVYIINERKVMVK